MKKFISGSILSVGLALAIAPILTQHATAAPKPAVKPVSITNYTSPLKEFAVWFPTKPTVENSVEKEPSSTTPIQNQTVSSESGDLGYVVVLSRSGSLAGISTKALLDELETGFAKEMKGKIVSSREIKPAAFPTREVLVDVDNVRFQMRITIAKNAMYQSFVGGLKSDVVKNKASVNKFLGSLRILKP